MEMGHHIVSLSLGTVAEPSALIVAEPSTKVWQPKDYDRYGKRPSRREENHFSISWLERFDPGRPIPAIVHRVNELVSDKRLARRHTVLLDITSTGIAPRRVFEGYGLYPTPIDLVATMSEDYSNGIDYAPLRDVIGAAQVVLQTKRIKVASELELAEILISDLQAFDPKPIDRNLRGGRNADLVFALAIALWWGDKLTWKERTDQRYDRRPKRIRSHWGI